MSEKSFMKILELVGDDAGERRKGYAHLACSASRPGMSGSAAESRLLE
jgi:hypothetical protein